MGGSSVRRWTFEAAIRAAAQLSLRKRNLSFHRAASIASRDKRFNGVVKLKGVRYEGFHIDQALSRFLYHYDQAPIARGHVFPGVTDVLTTLKSEGRKIAMLTAWDRFGLG